jgi:hypothetical protein
MINAAAATGSNGFLDTAQETARLGFLSRDFPFPFPGNSREFVFSVSWGNRLGIPGIGFHFRKLTDFFTFGAIFFTLSQFQT